MTPLIIAISGPSGSGKTLLVDNILSAFDSNTIAVIREDSYYKDQSHVPFSEREKRNYDEPDAFEHELLHRHLLSLSRNEPIDMPVYDYTTYTRLAQTNKINPAPIVLIDGILIFSQHEIRALSDLSLFIDAPLDTCLIRRIRRDISSRKRTVDSVLNQYELFVRPMYWQYIAPSKEYADVVVTGGGDNPKALDLIKVKIQSHLNSL
ncbi:MAG: uridine kinase [Legionellales bacterium]|nr:uridine kinase [Legionellales bacterium]|tara:strand:+ start:1737 stop:2357 length:621 start_codon:yes stop_codon:yes gene_type:complete